MKNSHLACGCIALALLFANDLLHAEEPVPKESASFTLDDVKLHATAESCWMAIEGRVYDVTSYIPRHPTKPEIMLEYCGKDATKAFQTKNKEKPHSARARKRLDLLVIGSLR